MCMMNNETIDAIMKHEGYEIRSQGGKLQLIDLVGQFIDCQFNTRQELNAYVEKHIAPHVGSGSSSMLSQGWSL